MIQIKIESNLENIPERASAPPSSVARGGVGGLYLPATAEKYSSEGENGHFYRKANVITVLFCSSPLIDANFQNEPPRLREILATPLSTLVPSMDALAPI